MSDDPFDDLDDDPARQGDPFADLQDDDDDGDDIEDIASGQDTPEESLFEDEQSGPGEYEDDEFGQFQPRETADETTASGETTGDETSTGGEATDHEVSTTGETPAQVDAESIPDDDPFREMGKTPRDGDPFADLQDGEESMFDDAIWEDLSEDPTAETVSEQQGNRRLSEVSKHSFCEQCEYFTGPPEIACTNEGTDILAFLDMETVRVADCPVVEEREEIQQNH